MLTNFERKNRENFYLIKLEKHLHITYIIATILWNDEKWNSACQSNKRHLPICDRNKIQLNVSILFQSHHSLSEWYRMNRNGNVNKWEEGIERERGRDVFVIYSFFFLVWVNVFFFQVKRLCCANTINVFIYQWMWLKGVFFPHRKAIQMPREHGCWLAICDTF